MFALEHFGGYTCGIPDNDTIVLTGGFTHNYVTRWDEKVIDVGHADHDHDNKLIMPISYDLKTKGSDFHHIQHILVSTEKICRYNLIGFVEELPQMPENRLVHSCASLPTTGVRPAWPT